MADNSTWRLIVAIVCSSLGAAWQHGYNTGVLNNPQEVMTNWTVKVQSDRTGQAYKNNDQIITIIWSGIVSIFCVGGMIGGLCSGVVAHKIGPKGGLLMNNIFVILAVICEGLAKPLNSYEMLLVGRLFIGFNSGLNAGLSPMYLTEISPVNIRGAVGSFYQFIIVVSILISQIFGMHQLMGTVELWPLLLVLTIVPAIFQMITFPFCPESPKHLVTKDKEEEAKKALIWLRGSEDVAQEMKGLKDEYEAAKSMPKITAFDLVKTRSLRTPLIISGFVMIAQQLSGINAVMFYSNHIFETSGLKGDSPTYATLGMGGINLLTTIVSVYLVEAAGRKTLLFIGFAGLTASTIFLIVFITFSEYDPLYGYACIAFVLIYVIFFAIGPGSIPWFLVSELFAQEARPAAVSISVGINWLFNTFVAISFMPLQQIMHQYVFLIFVVVQVITCLLIWIMIPETKNKPIEEITALFTT